MAHVLAIRIEKPEKTNRATLLEAHMELVILRIDQHFQYATEVYQRDRGDAHRDSRSFIRRLQLAVYTLLMAAVKSVQTAVWSLGGPKV